MLTWIRQKLTDLLLRLVLPLALSLLVTHLLARAPRDDCLRASDLWGWYNCTVHSQWYEDLD